MDSMNYFNNLNPQDKTRFLAASLDQEGDKYDQLGRNVSAQMRRQNLVPWVLVERTQWELLCEHPYI